MANIRPEFWIGERSDITVLVWGTSGDQDAAQEDGVALMLHKSVLSEYEYFKQLFAAQPEVSKHSFQLSKHILPASKHV
jgi:hypothetical protein